MYPISSTGTPRTRLTTNIPLVGSPVAAFTNRSSSYSRPGLAIQRPAITAKYAPAASRVSRGTHVPSRVCVSPEMRGRIRALSRFTGPLYSAIFGKSSANSKERTGEFIPVNIT